MYSQDYDEMMPYAFYSEGKNLSPPDFSAWQKLQFYLKNQQVYNCPSDPATDTQRATVEVPPPTTPTQRDYNLARKNDFAYNVQYLSPIGTNDGVRVTSLPIHLASLNRPADTIMATDSVWNRDSSGNPYGGGNASTDPPCRLNSSGDTFPSPNGFAVSLYWQGAWNPGHPQSWNVFGGVWFWHNGMTTVAFCDGHIKAENKDALIRGCEVKDSWGGKIFDDDAYQWELH